MLGSINRVTVYTQAKLGSDLIILLPKLHEEERTQPLRIPGLLLLALSEWETVGGLGM